MNKLSDLITPLIFNIIKLIIDTDECETGGVARAVGVPRGVAHSGEMVLTFEIGHDGGHVVTRHQNAQYQVQRGAGYRAAQGHGHRSGDQIEGRSGSEGGDGPPEEVGEQVHERNDAAAVADESRSQRSQLLDAGEPGAAQTRHQDQTTDARNDVNGEIPREIGHPVGYVVEAAHQLQVLGPRHSIFHYNQQKVFILNKSNTMLF